MSETRQFILFLLLFVTAYSSLSLAIDVKLLVLKLAPELQSRSPLP